MATPYVVFFDLETGGVEPQHPTIQLAAVAVDDLGSEASAFEIKIAFDEAAADPEALRMNHYDRAAWAKAVPPPNAAARFASWLRPYQSVALMSKRTNRPYHVARLSGYNALTFDLPRLRALFGDAFFPCEYLVRDVLQRALFYFDEHPNLQRPENFKLATLGAYFGLGIDGAHDALADARLTARLSRTIAFQEVT